MNKTLNKKVKKILAKSMALFILGGAGVTAVANSSIQAEASMSGDFLLADKFGYVKVDKGSTVNVRSGAGTKYKSLGKVGKGTGFALISKHGDWYKVVTYTSEGKRSIKGYIKKSYCSKLYEDGQLSVKNGKVIRKNGKVVVNKIKYTTC